MHSHPTVVTQFSTNSTAQRMSTKAQCGPLTHAKLITPFDNQFYILGTLKLPQQALLPSLKALQSTPSSSEPAVLRTGTVA